MFRSKFLWSFLFGYSFSFFGFSSSLVLAWEDIFTESGGLRTENEELTLDFMEKICGW